MSHLTPVQVKVLDKILNTLIKDDDKKELITLIYEYDLLNSLKDDSLIEMVYNDINKIAEINNLDFKLTPDDIYSIAYSLVEDHDGDTDSDIILKYIENILP